MLLLIFSLLFLILWGAIAFLLPRLGRLLTSLANKAAATSMRYGAIQRLLHHSSPFRDYLPVAAIVFAGGVLSVSAGDAFLDLAELVQQKSTVLNEFDTTAHVWARERRTSLSTLFFTIVTEIGGPISLAILAAVVAAVHFVRNHRPRATWLILTVCGGGLLNLELKRYFARARPDLAERLRDAAGYSFPSGHAMGATVVFGAFAYLAYRALPSWRTKSAAMALAITAILAVALSRVYLGVHWISDIGAGIAGGIVWVTLTTVAYETFRRIRRLRHLRAESSRVTPP